MQEIISSKPKHVQVADHIRKLVNNGTLKNGYRLLPDGELAIKYNVNRHTVAAGLKSLVKEGLLERAPRRGTIVIKDDTKGNKTSNAVGMIMLSKGDVYSEISRNITRGFTKHKLFPVLINGDVVSDSSSVVIFLETLNSEQPCPYGFIIDGNLEFSFEFIKQNIDKFNNIVFINKYHHPEKIVQAKYVLIDFAEAGRLAAKHFIAQGHKKLTKIIAI